MYRIRKEFLLLLGVLSLGQASCRKGAFTELDRTVPKDCGCTGQASVVLTDTLASLLPGGYIQIKGIQTNLPYSGRLTSCNPEVVKNLPASKEGEFNYKISGKLRPPCTAYGINYTWWIETSSIQVVK